MKRRLVIAGCGIGIVMAVLTALVPASFVYDPSPLVAALKASASQQITEQQPNPKSFILTNVRIFDQPADAGVTALRVDDGIIRQIGSDVGAGLPVIDGGGGYVSPGLIDAHVHLSFAPGAAVRGDNAATSAALREFHLRAYLASGVTTILDPGVDHEVAGHIRRWLNAGNPGPRYLHLGEPLVVEGGYVADLFPNAVSEMGGARAKIEALIASGAVGAKLPIEPGPIVDIWNTPTSAWIKAMVEETSAHRLPLYIHAMTNDAYTQALPLGAHAFLHHPATATDEVVAQTAASRAYVITTLSVWDVSRLLMNQAVLDQPHVALTTPPVVRAGLLDEARIHRANVGLISEVMPFFKGRWSDVMASLWATDLGTWVVDAGNASKLAEASAVVRRMHAAGVRIVMGSDSGNWPIFPYYLHGSTSLREMQLLVSAGLTPHEAVRAATSEPAAMLGLSDEVGSVSIGKRADLVLTAESPLVDVGRAYSSIKLVVRDGVARTPQAWMQDP